MGKISQGVLIGYSDLFGPSDKTVEEIMSGINREMALRAICHLLGPFLSDNAVLERDLITSFFNSKNKKYRDELLFKISRIQSQSKNVKIVNVKALLFLFEVVFNLSSDVENEFSVESEVSFFNAILIVNDKINLNPPKSINLINEGKFAEAVFSTSFSNYDFNNTDVQKIFITQVFKMNLLFEYLKKSECGNILLSKYINRFGITKLSDFVKALLSFLGHIIDNRFTNKSIEFIITDNLEYNHLFLDELIMNNEEGRFEEDFKTIRSNPIVKLKNGNYLIVYLPFVFECIFKGMYFKLNDINNTLKTNGEVPFYKDFRPIYCDEFSEKTLMQSVLLRVFKNKYLSFSGDEIKKCIKVKEPDFYIRNGKSVFLFESKDVLIKKEVLVSYDYHQYEKLLREKFMNSNENNKGIIQLINCVKDLFDDKYKFDSEMNPERIEIYPILVLHDKVFDVPGLNFILNTWFKIEVEKLKNLGYNTSRVKDLVVIDIDTLIYYSAELYESSLNFKVLLEKYIYSMSRHRKHQNKLNSFTSFSNFIASHFNDRSKYFNKVNLLNKIKTYLE